MEMQARRPHEVRGKTAAAAYAAVVALTLAMRYRIAIFPFCNTCARRRVNFRAFCWWHDGDRGDGRGGRRSAHPRTLTSISCREQHQHLAAEPGHAVGGHAQSRQCGKEKEKTVTTAAADVDAN